ncbi:hypothetical protein D9M69_67640 [compost metagenome]
MLCALRHKGEHRSGNFTGRQRRHAAAHEHNTWKHPTGISAVSMPGDQPLHLERKSAVHVPRRHAPTIISWPSLAGLCMELAVSAPCLDRAANPPHGQLAGSVGRRGASGRSQKPRSPCRHRDRTPVRLPDTLCDAQSTKRELPQIKAAQNRCWDHAPRSIRRVARCSSVRNSSSQGANSRARDGSEAYQAGNSQIRICLTFRNAPYTGTVLAVRSRRPHAHLA